MRLAAVLLCLSLNSCFLGGGDDDPDEKAETKPCFWVVLQLSQGVTNVPEFGARRLLDNETMCWTLTTTTDESTDRVEVELSRVFSIEGERRYGCEFRGSGNSLRTELSEGRCLLRHGDGFVRMELSSPVEIQLQSLRDTLLTIEMSYEQREGNIVRHGDGVLSLASQTVLGPGTVEWQNDLDARGPTADPFDSCPALPLCATVDLAGMGELRGNYADDPGCQDWLANRVNYGTVFIGLTRDGDFDWDPSTDGGVFGGIRELDSCTVTAWSGTAPTNDNVYVTTFDGPDRGFQMVLKDLYRHMGQTRYCEAEWAAPIELTACP